MKVKLKKDPKSDIREIEVAEGTRIEDVVNRYRTETPYRVVAAKVDNKLEDLSFLLKQPCTIEFQDIRQREAHLVYQQSLCFVYLKAVFDVLGKVDVSIRHPLNQGIYTKIGTAPVTEQQVAQIEKQMRNIIAEDIPVIRKSMKRKEAFEFLTADGQDEKARILEKNPDIEWVRFYSIGDYSDFFYDLLTPSTGYIEYFEIRKYQNGVLLRFPNSASPKEIPAYRDDVKLYEAFREAKRWEQIMEIAHVADLNDKIRAGQYKDLIQLSEALHEKKVAEIADKIAQQKKRVILIAGPSSSGKTTFAKRLCVQMRVNGYHPLYMSTDDYFVERALTPLDAYGEPDFESIDAIEVKMFNEHINGLLRGEEVDLPTFDFINGTKKFGARIASLRAGEPIVVEGIHALNEAMTPAISKESKFKIYISPFTQLNLDEHNRIPVTDGRMLRRMVRDNQFRGHSARKTINAWPKVRAGEDKYIFPYNGEADVFFNSAHIYELAVLKKYAWPLLTDISPEAPEYGEAARMLRFLSFFEPIEDDSIIVNNSIMREFIGGSVFV